MSFPRIAIIHRSTESRKGPMASEHIRAFISSRMQELALEREAIKASLAELHIDTFVFEKDAGARPQSIQQTYLLEVEAADLYVGVFWRGYGVHTIEEFEEATLLGMECFLYEKREDIEGSRAPELQTFLDRLGDPESGLTIGRFNTADELGASIKKDVALWRDEIRDAAKRPRATALYHGVPSRPMSDFVGRSDEIQRMVRRLRSGEDLAIEGLPGVGKTTLAVVLAHYPGIRRRFKDGVLWASLGPNADVAIALANWAGALQEAGLLKKDVTSLPMSQRSQALRDAISEGRLLLVIDDVWQIDAGRLLKCGGRNCAHLVTTRDNIIARELAGPAHAETLPSLDHPRAYELRERLAPEVCRSAPDVIRKLLLAAGGLPLAVRLIAGHLTASTGAYPRMFPKLREKALGELSDARKRLELAEQRLGSGERISLQDTIALSLNGLPEPARHVFYKLGAFAAKPETFNLEAAEAVTEGEDESLMLLASRNLLEIDEQNLKIAVHATVVDLARTQLDAATITRHREYYLSLVRENIKDWRLIEDAYGQIRWAWQQAPDDQVLLQFVRLLDDFQTRRGLFVEKLAWGQRTLAFAEKGDLQPAVRQALKGQVLTVMGRTHKGMGYLEKALQCHNDALTIWQALQDQFGADGLQRVRSKQIESLIDIGLHLAERGQPDLGLEKLRGALALAEESGSEASQAESLLMISYVLRREMRHEQALEYIHQALEVYRKLGDKSGEANTLATLAMIHRNMEQAAPALEYIRQVLTISEEMSNRDRQAEARIGMASVYSQQGRLEDALATAQEALRISLETGDRGLQVDSLSLLGNIHCRLKQPEKALEYFQQRLSLEKDEGDRLGLAAGLKDVGWFHREQGDREQALETYRQVLTIGDELGTDGKRTRAAALTWMGIIHADLGQTALELECLQKELEIWRDLSDRSEQAGTLQWIGRAHVALAQEDQGLHFYRQALDLYRELGDKSGQAKTLASIASCYERSAQHAPEPRQDLLRQAITTYQEAIETAPSEPLNYSRLARAWESLEDTGSMLENLDRAASALQHASQLAPDNKDVVQKLQMLERKRAHVQRFGEKVLNRVPVVTRIAVEVSHNLSTTSEEDNRQFEEGFRDNAAGLRHSVFASRGVRLPEIHFRRTPSDVLPGSYLIWIDEVPTLTGTVSLERRLYPGLLEDLPGVPGEKTINPQNGSPATWVSRPDWAKLEAAGKSMWGAAEYIVRSLENVIRRQLNDFIGHQETMELLEASLPEAAERMRERPVELSVLVMVLKNLLEEFVPIVAFKKIVETFEELRKSGLGRLAILQAIRCIPEVRADLPGNDGKSSFYRLGARMEEKILSGIRTDNTLSYLWLGPDATQQILRRVREKIHSNPQVYAALLVENPAIRRFARKLTELEFPYLAVLARQELLAGPEVNVIDVIE